jgi:hypothetical protein
MFLTAAIASACMAGCASIATAQGNFPEKPLQLIVPFPAGGASDVVGRIIAGELETRLGKPVIVLNRPGGGTTIAAKEVAIAAPDGYTLFSSSNSTFTLQNAVKENVPYDSAKDFEPIAQTGTITMVLVTHRDNPIKDVAALVAALFRRGMELVRGDADRDAGPAIEAARAVGDGLAAAEADPPERVVERFGVRPLELGKDLPLGLASEVRARRRARDEEAGKSNRGGHGAGGSSSKRSHRGQALQRCYVEAVPARNRINHIFA